MNFRSEFKSEKSFLKIYYLHFEKTTTMSLFFAVFLLIKCEAINLNTKIFVKIHDNFRSEFTRKNKI